MRHAEDDGHTLLVVIGKVSMHSISVARVIACASGTTGPQLAGIPNGNGHIGHTVIWSAASICHKV